MKQCIRVCDIRLCSAPGQYVLRGFVRYSRMTLSQTTAGRANTRTERAPEAGPMDGRECSPVCLSHPRGMILPSLAGSCTGYQTAWRLQGRSFVPRSLPVPARRPVWCRRVRATREGGRPSVERECQANRCSVRNRARNRTHPENIPLRDADQPWPVTEPAGRAAHVHPSHLLGSFPVGGRNP
jgi:hypothetical protein